MKQNKILINTLPLLSKITGVGRYIVSISEYLEQKNNFETKFYYGYFSNDLTLYSRTNLPKKIFDKFIFLKKIARKILSTNNKYFSPAFDLYWEPNFIPLQNIKAKKIITSVHDFSFELYKEYHPKERIEYFEKYFYENIQKSNFIICFSEFTKNEIIQKVKYDIKKIKVIPHGVDHNLFKKEKDLSLKFILPKKFILSVGSIEPRKNLIGLLRAYNILKEDIKKKYKLVLVGFKGWENKEIMNLINNNKDNVYYLGYVDDHDLVKVYNLASLFVYPSFYEGFGLPILEAMACGVPIICSDTSSMPEVGGDCVQYFNPNDIEAIKFQIEYVLSNKTLQKEMVLKGLSRAQEFTWEKSAKKHLKLFNQILQ